MEREGSPDQLWTTREVAERIGVTPRTVKAWRSQGRGPEPVRIGYRTIRYRPAVVEAWIAQQETPAAQAS